MSCVTDGLLHWVNAANNASLFVEGRKENIVNLLIRLKGNSKHISGSSLSPLGDQIPGGRDSAYERCGDARRLA